MGFQLPFPQLVFSPDVRTINSIGGPQALRVKGGIPPILTPPKTSKFPKNLQVPLKTSKFPQRIRVRQLWPQMKIPDIRDPYDMIGS